MDIGTLIGMLAALGLIISASAMGSTIQEFVGTFFDGPSVMIVVGGCVAVMFVMYPVSVVFGGLKTAMKCFLVKQTDNLAVIDQIVLLGEKARKESIVSLEKVHVPYPFMARGIMLVADGTEAGLLRNILDIDMSLMQQRHWRGQDLFKSMGTYAPAFGMMGTLIGLVQMLRNMDDPSSIGPAMALALLTTFYGALMANAIFLPMAKKLEERSKEEYHSMEIMREGILSIQKGEHPALIREKLQSFLPPSMRRQAR